MLGDRCLRTKEKAGIEKAICIYDMQPGVGERGNKAF
jgi:hypothetical protein